MKINVSKTGGVITAEDLFFLYVGQISFQLRARTYLNATILALGVVYRAGDEWI